MENGADVVRQVSGVFRQRGYLEMMADPCRLRSVQTAACTLGHLANGFGPDSESIAVFEVQGGMAMFHFNDQDIRPFSSKVVDIEAVFDKLFEQFRVSSVSSEIGRNPFADI